MSNVNHPSHYNQGKVECIDAIEAATAGLTGSEAFCTGSAIKYLWRWKQKNGAEDLEKAKWYLEKLLEGLQTPDLIVDDLVPEPCDYNECGYCMAQKGMPRCDSAPTICDIWKEGQK